MVYPDVGSGSGDAGSGDAGPAEAGSAQVVYEQGSGGQISWSSDPADLNAALRDIATTVGTLSATVNDHSDMLSCEGSGRRMAEDETTDDSVPSKEDELRAFVAEQVAAATRALTAQMAAQAAEMASLKAWKADLEEKAAQDPELKKQLFGQPTLSQVQ